VDDAAMPPGGPPIGRAEIRPVPVGGLPVWADPDPTEAPIAELPAGFELVIVGRRGSWVHVQAEGLDGWVDGSQLAGAGVMTPVAERPVGPEAVGHMPVPPPAPGAVVVEKQVSSVQLGRGPLVGALGAMIAVFGTALPWQQTVANRLEVDAYGIPVRFLTGWQNLADKGFALGWLIVILAVVGAVVSLISGGGIVRRVLGLVIILVCCVYALQQQDWLTTTDRGLGTGLNLWDVIDNGVAVTFAGGMVMLFAPSR
jgi:Bacterial SH3 domain